MSDYEKLNQRVSAQKVVRRKETFTKLGLLLMIIATVLLMFWGLEHIGFISDMFFVILVSITVCTGSFHAGRIFEGYRR